MAEVHRTPGGHQVARKAVRAVYGLAERGGLVGVAPGKRRIFGQVARLPDAFNKSESDDSRPPVPACRRSFGVGQTNVFGLVGMC